MDDRAAATSAEPVANEELVRLREFILDTAAQLTDKLADLAVSHPQHGTHHGRAKQLLDALQKETHALYASPAPQVAALREKPFVVEADTGTHPKLLIMPMGREVRQPSGEEWHALHIASRDDTIARLLKRTVDLESQVAALSEENKDLRRRLANQFAEINSLRHVTKERDDARAEVASLSAALEEAKRDTQRLDWLQSVCRWKFGMGGYGTISPAERYDFAESTWFNIEGHVKIASRVCHSDAERGAALPPPSSLRESVDTARAALPSGDATR